jgi:hypothetical protein
MVWFGFVQNTTKQQRISGQKKTESFWAPLYYGEMFAE